jgi:hypothetical protein
VASTSSNCAMLGRNGVGSSKRVSTSLYNYREWVVDRTHRNWLPTTQSDRGFVAGNLVVARRLLSAQLQPVQRRLARYRGAVRSIAALRVTW